MKINKNHLIGGGTIIVLIVIGYFLFKKKKETIEAEEIVKDDNSNDEISTEEKVKIPPVKQNTSETETSNAVTPPKKEETKPEPDLFNCGCRTRYAFNKEKREECLKQCEVENKNILRKDKVLWLMLWSLPKSRKYWQDLPLNQIEDIFFKTPIDFINAWIKAVKLRISSKGKNGTTFTYNGAIYDSYYGAKRMNENPINKFATTRKDAFVQYTPDFNSSERLKALKGKKLGVVKGYRFNIENKLMWLFIPDTVVTLADINPFKESDWFNEFKWIPFSDVYLSYKK
jgi:hypothetical protein